ncbi:exodeoxyribonuclease V subunit beta [Aestuariirhabdus sp. Z084]|uniref:exodeoxyribonuclease V subunit beta n=1 Tax=Aestuariirhabdus haliotis TaxID=2918751 RepID=UPI00201B4252|nr:exodeoxyribonuclease V subunit beta [Aestuariirhabdus haliotis]MCL6415830.1 exodeoxyribonuclease V subunit beta [Aestuariirhabdus haliotis]MCL6419868.1 exodeoxyribonuclease V subunit beta [Aestuariirhabdus haliotis]
MNTPLNRQQLDPLNLPLTGVQLIEASAGTGKTFTITLLYLRALLGVGRETALNADSILVVTFTEAATEELRDRIRKRIVEARQAVLSGESTDPGLTAILQASPFDDREIALRLEQAARQMDEAAIYTIHGFCHRMLTRNAFESGMLFSSEFTMDDSLMKLQAINDFWRSTFYPLDDDLIEVVQAHWKTPRSLLNSIDHMINAHEVMIIPESENDDLQSVHGAYRQQLLRFKADWQSAGDDLFVVIDSSGIKRNPYNKTNLPKWLAAVNDWAASSSLSLPKELEKFSQSVLNEKTKQGGVPPAHSVFASIDQLLVDQPPYQSIIQRRALNFVSEHLQQQKQQRALLLPDDLLSRFANALSGERADLLAARVRELFPLALIDEFQDTDPQQYQIFDRLYGHQGAEGTALLMIGDPKQAIYSFRGADIFTYMSARHRVDGAYSMSTNWRSTQAMVDGVNALFRFSRSPFVYQNEITYDQVSAAGKADSKPLRIDGQVLKGLTIWQHPSGDDEVSADEIKQVFARSTALEISRLLNAAYAGDTSIGDGSDGERALQPGDIAILVRSRFEAATVRSALAQQQIDAVFLSRDRVFETRVAQDLYRLLLAVNDPSNERQFNAALATGLLGYSAGYLDQLSRNEQRWEATQQHFLDAREQWYKSGVLPMLYQLMRKLEIAESLIARDAGERDLTDLLHLGELLQQASMEVEGEHGLLRWFAQQLSEEGEAGEAQQLRLESDRKLVKIVTIHRSKGLEYGVVFVPFICCYSETKSTRYHKNGQSIWDLAGSEEAVENAQRERLAEDLRLLYVALTRAIHACYIGAANLKGRQPVRLAGSAFGYLLNSSAAGTLEGDGMTGQLQRLQQQAVQWYGQGAVHLAPAPLDSCSPVIPPEPDLPELELRSFRGQIARDWRIGSYSALLTPHRSTRAELPGYAVELQDESMDQPVTALSPVESLNAFSFPRGAEAGTFLHELFENIEFDKANSELLAPMLLSRLQSEGYDSDWQEPLSDWLLNVLSSPLPEFDESFSLNCLGTDKMRVEMEFLIPVSRLDASALNQLLKTYSHLPTEGLPALAFNRLKGMLKGFIDLVFEADGRYFVLDYKSNHLGDSLADYSPLALQQAMLEHRYDLQYVLYTLALHRYLKTRLPDYCYEQHFGGCYYLFLRGMADGSGQQGVYFDKPDQRLIEALDALFEGNNGAGDADV